jgi:hypothetical protein
VGGCLLIVARAFLGHPIDLCDRRIDGAGVTHVLADCDPNSCIRGSRFDFAIAATLRLGVVTRGS